MSRSLKFRSVVNSGLGANQKFKFSQSHALNIFPSDAIYTFIPKNACSTLRLSIAIENGFIKSESHINWIHNNNQTFSANLSQLVKAKYTFVILRCPFSRLASAYLDKIVNRDVVAWKLLDSLNRKVAIEDLTFNKFVESLDTGNILRSDSHWRPQIDFLAYDNYDSYFNFSNLESMKSTLKNKIGLEVVDARGLTKHGSDQFSLETDHFYGDTLPLNILNMNSKGISVSPRCLYSKDTIEAVEKLYKADINLFTSCFGKESLLKFDL